MTWHRWASRQNVDITTIAEIDRIFYDLIKQAIDRGEFFTHVKNKGFTHYATVDLDTVGRCAYKKFFNSPQQIKEYHTQGKKILKDIKKKTLFLKKKLSESCQDSEVLSAFHDFRTQFKAINFIFSIASFVAIEAWQKDCDQAIQRAINRNNLEKSQEKIYSSLYKPWKNTALIEIQRKLRRGISPSALRNDYAFLRSWSLIWYKDLDEQWFSSLRQRESKPNTLSIAVVKTMLNPTSEEEYFIELAPYITFFKDWRDDLRRRHCYEWSFIFKMLAEKWKVDTEDIGYLTLDEIEGYLLHGFDMDIINKRKNTELTVTADETGIQIFDCVPEKYASIINIVRDETEAFELHGTTAHPGMVTGSVTIIRSHHDIKKVQDGDILMANTTHPNYLPAMSKAAAFVTNEGGMLSHAAIVAREMKKPCVVGTRRATEVFKDGDIVEVDAVKGLVKLSKNQPTTI